MNSGRDVIVTLSAKMQDLPHFFQGTCFVDWVLCQKPWRSVRTFVRLRFFLLPGIQSQLQLKRMLRRLACFASAFDCVTLTNFG